MKRNCDRMYYSFNHWTTYIKSSSNLWWLLHFWSHLKCITDCPWMAEYEWKWKTNELKLDLLASVFCVMFVFGMLITSSIVPYWLMSFTEPVIKIFNSCGLVYFAICTKRHGAKMLLCASGFSIFSWNSWKKNTTQRKCPFFRLAFVCGTLNPYVIYGESNSESLESERNFQPKKT